MSASQNKQILEYLRTAPLTALGALKLFNCLRLAARIHELRERGHNIQVRTVPTKTGKRIAMYFLSPERSR